MGKIKVLDTPSGRILKDLINAGVKLGISSRGLGSVKEQWVIPLSKKILNLSALILSPSLQHQMLMYIPKHNVECTRTKSMKPSKISLMIYLRRF